MEMELHRNSSVALTPDPWSVHGTAAAVDNPVDIQFENDFTLYSQQPNYFQPLPDTKEYLQRLERKLNKLKNGPQSDQTKRRQIIDQLCDARKACLENLVDSNDIVFDPEHSIEPSGLSSWINPEQPLSSVETQKLIEPDV